NGSDIDPTPVVGTIGLIDRLVRRPPVVGLVEEASLVHLGPRSDALAGSRWARQLRGATGGRLAAPDLALHGRLLRLVAGLVNEASIDEAGGSVPIAGLHDVSDGGLAVCLAELAAASGVGAVVGSVSGHAELFSEAPSRVVVCTTTPDEVLAAARAAGVPAEVIGRTGGDRLVVGDIVDLAVADIQATRAGRLPDALDFVSS
ncbi:MAG TPA: AIR synthase-related protein, partial [Acidimicrobiales bacterium]|nr:AIR synthase-related protein [Acidimicrobiales bacterium]